MVQHTSRRALFVTLAVVLAFIAALLPARAAPALAQEETVQADATLRVIHASPGAPEVDVLVDGQPVMQRLAYGDATDYQTMTPQQHRVQIVPTGQTADAAVVDETIDAAPGQAYLVAVYGFLNDIGGDVYEVDMSEVEPGTARVRFINFSPDAGDLDLLETGGDEWFTDVGLGEATDYRDVGPGVYSVDLRGDDDRVLKTISDLNFEETRVYDIVALGQIADDSLTVQALVTSISPPCAEVIGLEGSGSDACLRIVHAAPDAPPVDVYINDAQIAQDLEYGTATEYAAVPSGAGRAVRVTATGAPAEEAVVDTSLDFEAGQAYEILVVGGGDKLEAVITGTDLRPLPAGQARIRVVNASPDAGAFDIGIKGQEENLFEGINDKDSTHYVVIDAGDYTLEVRPGGQDMTVAAQSDVTLDEGVTYDLIAIGRPEDRSLQLLALPVKVAIQTGEVATPEATAEAPLAETVVPQPAGGMEASPTPAS
jgi:hypothetical protein